MTAEQVLVRLVGPDGQRLGGALPSVRDLDLGVGHLREDLTEQAELSRADLGALGKHDTVAARPLHGLSQGAALE